MGKSATTLALLAVASSAVAQVSYDLNGDGIATAPGVRAIVTDLDADGLFDFGRYDDRLITLTRGAGEVHMVRLDGEIRGISARDVDLDGTVDLEILLAAGDRRVMLNGELPWPATGAQQRFAQSSVDWLRSPCAGLSEIWSTGNELNNVWGAAAGDFDGDGNGDILSENWPTPTMRVYETDGNDSFALVFTTPTAHAPPGAYVAVTGGDSDLDGQGEIIGGETSTLNQVFLYESTGDNTYVRRDVGISEPDFSGSKSMGKVRIADADRDGRKEIIFDTSSVSGSALFVYEHSGAVGENTYTKVYSYSTVSYLFNWTVGDSDNDGHEEIVLGFGGGGSFPIYLRRLENTGDNTFQHKLVQPGGTGLALAPAVADIDGDGLNELVFGGAVYGSGGGVFIYEATGDDTYELAYSEGGLDGNGLCSVVGALNCGADPVVAIGSFEAQLEMWIHDGSTYQRALTSPITSEGAIRTVGLGRLDADQKPDLLFSSSGSDDRVYVYEVGDIVGDTNCDGLVDFGDINPFVLALTDPAGYAQAFPYCDIMNADINADGRVDFGDINPFVRLLTQP